jgi:thiol-disulfide isomerase/thioredoxin
MARRWWLGVGLVALSGALALAAGLLLVRSPGPGSGPQGAPPVAGEVRNFTPIDPPSPAPDITFRDGDGEETTLARFRGSVTLVNFWATWCVPCVKEMPSLDRLAARLGPEGLAVLPISQDRDPAVIRPFYAARRLTALGRWHDPGGALAQAFAVPGLPTTFLIDRDGRVVGLLLGPAEWDSPEAVALLRHYLAADR